MKPTPIPTVVIEWSEDEFVAAQAVQSLTAELYPPKCERCKQRDARPTYRLCKQCNDDDDAAMLAAYMCVG